MSLAVLVLLFMVTSPAEAIAAPSPVRRIITMLQMMQKRVEMEGKNSQVLFDKYMCHCHTTLHKLSSDIELGKETVPQLHSSIEEQVAQKGGLKNDIKDAKAEFAEAEKTLQEASSLRTKENKDFVAQDIKMKVDIKALHQAIKGLARLGEGEGGSFLQAGIASSVSSLIATSTSLSSSDRDVVTNFLAQSASDQDGASDDIAQSSPDEILGILKQMADSMMKDHADLTAGEKSGAKEFDSLKSAKESQMSSLKSEIDSKTDRASLVGLQTVEDQSKLDDTQKALEANTKMEASLSKECKIRQQEYDIQTKTRAEETVAISDTMKLLNDNAAEKLFKKTMPAAAASLLQMQVSPKELRSEALQTIQSASANAKRDPRMDFVALALRGKKTSFAKVLQMIDAMVVLLNKEQKEDEDKKSFCQSEIDKSSDEKKELDQAISDLSKAVEASAQKLKALASDIKSKNENIKTLDEQVTDMTKQRKEEHQDYNENFQASNAAKEILGVAKARLSKFYDSEAAQAQNAKAQLLQAKLKGKVHIVGKALRIKSLRPVQRSPTDKQSKPLSEKSRASLTELFDNGGAFSFTQVDMQTHAEGNKVVTLIGSIMVDIEKEVQEMKKSEDEAQFEYQQILKESAEKRAEEAKAISVLGGYKAEVEAELHEMLMDVKSKKNESDGKSTYLEDLHKSCDWLLENFQTRRSARTAEIDALQKATQTLTGADEGFLQVKMRTWKGLRLVKEHI